MPTIVGPSGTAVRVLPLDANTMDFNQVYEQLKERLKELLRKEQDASKLQETTYITAAGGRCSLGQSLPFFPMASTPKASCLQ